MKTSLYLHIPFCTHRCAYCDFNTYAGQQELIPAYVTALCDEIAWVGARAPEELQIHTVFFGGGTPSLLSPQQFETILDRLARCFRLADGAEITMEANPGTVCAQDLCALRRLGINRISLGMQSGNGEELRLLERTHTYLDVLRAVSAARRAGFENLSLDLIYGLPEQTLETWQSTVRRALELRPEHLSAYALTFEHGTPFGGWARRGLMPMPDPDAAADMYEWLSEEVTRAGYVQYEISNWSREGRACRHNLQYWRGLPYLGLGAGAHGYAGGYRYSNVLAIKAYIGRLREASDHGSNGGQERIPFPLSPAAVDHHAQSASDDMAEFMIMGLRLTGEGVSKVDFRERFGVQLQERFEEDVADLLRLGLLEEIAPDAHEQAYAGALPRRDDRRLRLTQRGRLLGNQVFMRFV